MIFLFIQLVALPKNISRPSKQFLRRKRYYRGGSNPAADTDPNEVHLTFTQTHLTIPKLSFKKTFEVLIYYEGNHLQILIVVILKSSFDKNFDLIIFSNEIKKEKL